MDGIRAQCAKIRGTAEGRAAEFSAAAESNTARLVFISTAGSLLLLIFLAICAVTIFRSLSHREKLYRQAAANAELLTVTLSSIGDAVIATDANTRITFLNPVAQRLTGWAQDEALGTPVAKVFRIISETTRLAVENPLEKALATGIVVGLANHTILIAKNGEEIHIDDSGAPIRDTDGKILAGC